VLATFLLFAAAIPPVSLGNPDARGCGVIQLGTAPAEAGPVGLCVKQVLWTPLEGGLVAALVEAPHRFEPRPRNRVFLYRLEGRRLVPRFLGSGFDEVQVERLLARDDSLGLAVRGERGERTLACRFSGFPLVCSEEE
jgi:hypothetical protein